MAQLDKTFPTNDCSICILAPKMVECARHPNVTLLTYSELNKAQKIGDVFQVEILKKPRYVDPDKCTGCRQCSERCPIEVPNEFEMGLKNRNAIYIPFPQAVPNVATIDMENCILCRACEKTCKAAAIDFTQQPEYMEASVKSIILAVGFQLLDISGMERFGHGRYKNVLTSLEYERILSASGPTHGHVVRPSDGREVSTLTFVQCVGSRSVKNVPYCSKICCMYTTKQAIITKEHLKDVQIRILYNDLRASGKGFYEFIERGRSNEYNIQYIKGLPGKISEDPITKNILITFEDMSNHSFQEIECDLVVLAPAMIPNPDLVKLARILELELDEHGFVKTPYFNAHATSQSGIFVIGTASGPKDIPESVAEASGCAALATKSSVTKITPLVGEEPLEEKDVKSPRIGIFACHCGSNIGGIVNIPEVVEYARTLPNVVFSMDNLYTCSEDSQKIIQEKIKEHDLTRVIVASCTPSTHEPLFRKTCQEAGLNPYLFDLANIREQCSWVHMREPEKATEKAKDIIRMYAARVLDSEPLNKIKNSIIPEVLVIGGGIAGMEAAHTISSHGFRVHLFEKSNELGGMLKNY